MLYIYVGERETIFISVWHSSEIELIKLMQLNINFGNIKAKFIQKKKSIFVLLNSRVILF